MSNRISIETDPSGADVFLRANASGRPEWQPVGESPIANRRLPLGAFRLRVEKNGFETRELLLSLSCPQTDGSFRRCRRSPRRCVATSPFASTPPEPAPGRHDRR